MARREGHGFWPYWVPYGVFLLLVQVEGWLPASWAPGWLAVKVLVPGGLFLGFVARGAYPELRGYRPRPGAVAADVGVGLGVAALWMAPFLLFPALAPDSADGFDPTALGEAGVPALLGLRLLGFAGVTPFVEELFVRSWLLRYIDVFDRRRDFRDEPIGRFRWRSFLVTVFYFTFSHVSWEWGVAAATGAIYNLWLYHRRHIGAPIVAHAVTNATIFWVVVAGGPDLYYFL